MQQGCDARLDTSLEMLLDCAPRDGRPRVLATLVLTAGSNYRKPGARMLILAGGNHVGLLSGGCLEADLGIHAQQVLQSGIPRAVEYDMRAPDDILFGIGAGCEGAMPAGPDAQPVVHAALALGWRVSVVDHRPAYATAERFPGASVVRTEARRLRSVISVDQCHAAVVMSHHLPSDIAYLAQLAAAGRPAYVGLLGPSARRHRIADELGATAVELRSRLHSPVGLDIGAVTPEGIALAIISQIHAHLATRSVSHDGAFADSCG
jgi:xanthine/CO dehydrogenase XdhC/CoxF family maturation factor